MLPLFLTLSLFPLSPKSVFFLKKKKGRRPPQHGVARSAAFPVFSSVKGRNLLNRRDCKIGSRNIKNGTGSPIKFVFLHADLTRQHRPVARFERCRTVEYAHQRMERNVRFTAGHHMPSRKRHVRGHLRVARNQPFELHNLAVVLVHLLGKVTVPC